jgi:hypothetical protein
MSVTRPIEFAVKWAEQKERGFFATGRCSQGPIRVGDSFTAIYKLAPTRPAESPDIHSEERALLVQVHSIEVFRRALDELPIGTTAKLGLTFSGEIPALAGYVLGLASVS